VRDVIPWEDASGGKAVECAASMRSCSAQFAFAGASGWYDIDVQYFDVNTGAARFKLFVGAQQVDAWTADALLPGAAPNGDSSTRRRIGGIALRTQDVIRIEGSPEGGDRAAFDYVELAAQGER
jgi:alpha-glucuronidase